MPQSILGGKKTVTSNFDSVFDGIIDRRASDSIKWQHYGDALPLWVADMDFRSPEPVIRALQERVAHGVFGYGFEPAELREVFTARLAELYGWRVAPEAVLFVPGVVTGFNWALRQFGKPGDGVLVQTPVYPPILSAPGCRDMLRQESALVQGRDGRYTIDMDGFAGAVTPLTRLFLLCNPHNPVGRVFSPAELSAMAEVCLRNDVLIISDEIHCDLLFPGERHQPIAALAPEIGRRTVTLMAPSKTYNIAGLKASVMIVEDLALRRRLSECLHDVAGSPNVLGMTAMLAAYREGGPWLEELLAYLTANRDYLLDYVAEELPGIHMVAPEATYLAWLDCRDASLPGSPFKFFLKQAKVALNDGCAFGPGGDGFVRLNFGCPRAILREALERMKQAIDLRLEVY